MPSAVRAPAVRAALLAGVWLGALAVLAPDGAHAVDGTWLGGQAPNPARWTQGSNWSSSPSVPDDIATFTSGLNTTVTISGSVDINTIQFDPTAPAYSFTNSGFFTINGAGIVNNSASTSSFTNNAFIQFSNASTAANAAIANNGALTFVDTSTAGNASIINNGGGSLISFTDSSTAGNATITTNNFAKTQFATNGTGGNAQLITAAGGIVDFSLSSGPAGDNKLSAGSLAGAGTYFLGANQLTVGGNNLSTTVEGVISDCGLGGSECNNLGATGGALVKVGTGTMILSGDNTYTGGTTISGGALQLGDGGASGSIVGNVVNNSIFAINRSDTYIFGGAISGTGAFMQLGTGTTVLTGTNTYTGATNVNAGTLQAGAANAFSPFSAFSVASGARLDFNSFNQTIGSLAGAGIVTLGAATLTAGNDNTSTTFSGAIFGTGGLTKTGAGTFSSQAPAPIPASTTVNAGTLSVNGSIADVERAHRERRRHHRRQRHVGHDHHQRRHALARQLDRHPHRAGQPGADLGRRLPRRGLAHERRPHQCHRHGEPRRHRAGGVRPGRLYRAHLHHPLGRGRKHRHVRSLTTSGLPAGFTASLSYTATDVILNLTATLGNSRSPPQA